MKKILFAIAMTFVMIMMVSCTISYEDLEKEGKRGVVERVFIMGNIDRVNDVHCILLQNDELIWVRKGDIAGLSLRKGSKIIYHLESSERKEVDRMMIDPENAAAPADTIPEVPKDSLIIEK